MQTRFNVAVKAAEYNGHTGVTFILFHQGELAEEVYRDFVQDGVDWRDDNVQSVVNDTFSADECVDLHRYFSQWEDQKLMATPASLAGENQIGVSAMASGRAYGFYRFSDENGYSVPFPVWGFVDLRHADDGPWVRSPR
jgi:hypothetical protein